MIKNILRVHVLLVITSLVLSFGIVRWRTQANVPPCVNSPDCELSGPVQGTLRTIKDGYPLVYREKVVFEPSSGADYSSASIETEGFNLPNALINTLFWYALLTLITRYFADQKITPKKKTSKK